MQNQTKYKNKYDYKFVVFTCAICIGVIIWSFCYKSVKNNLLLLIKIIFFFSYNLQSFLIFPDLVFVILNLKYLFY